MELTSLFGKSYLGKTVLITGHTGFKGSWLSAWLLKMGANVIGFSDEILKSPNHFEALDCSKKVTSIFGDVRDLSQLKMVFRDYRPEIVFHLAAQPLVRASYQNPVATFATNIMGTINLLECCRVTENVKAVVIVTSDKCYENLEQNRPFVEDDKMGGYDPYSSSKGAAEIVTNSYRTSFFNLKEYGKKHSTLIASGRAGNVIGGGDWAEDRLIPDMVRATDKNQAVHIRNPRASRPWQHVLEPLSGYLQLGQQLLERKVQFAEGWNFGPKDQEVFSVGEIIKLSKKSWDKIEYVFNEIDDQPYEAKFLSLDCTKAHQKMNWYPVWTTEESIEKTTLWYKEYYEQGILKTDVQILEYVATAQEKNYSWAT